jgi:hypothetical protein
LKVGKEKSEKIILHYDWVEIKRRDGNVGVIFLYFISFTSGFFFLFMILSTSNLEKEIKNFE